MCVKRAPQKPFTMRSDGLSVPGSKSSSQCEMYAVHQLLTPMTSESVSKRVSLSVAIVAFACIASTLKYYSQCLRLQIRAMKIDELACKSIGLSNCELMNLLNK